jgi:hypothetical protein
MIVSIIWDVIQFEDSYALMIKYNNKFLIVQIFMGMFQETNKVHSLTQ